jgi:hypothetical protein
MGLGAAGGALGIADPGVAAGTAGAGGFWHADSQSATAAIVDADRILFMNAPS